MGQKDLQSNFRTTVWLAMCISFAKHPTPLGTNPCISKVDRLPSIPKHLMEKK